MQNHENNNAVIIDHRNSNQHCYNLQILLFAVFWEMLFILLIAFKDAMTNTGFIICCNILLLAILFKFFYYKTAKLICDDRKSLKVFFLLAGDIILLVFTCLLFRKIFTGLNTSCFTSCFSVFFFSYPFYPCVFLDSKPEHGKPVKENLPAYLFDPIKKLMKLRKLPVETTNSIIYKREKTISNLKEPESHIIDTISPSEINIMKRFDKLQTIFAYRISELEKADNNAANEIISKINRSEKAFALRVMQSETTYIDALNKFTEKATAEYDELKKIIAGDFQDVFFKGYARFSLDMDLKNKPRINVTLIPKDNKRLEIQFSHTESVIVVQTALSTIIYDEKLLKKNGIDNEIKTCILEFKNSTFTELRRTRMCHARKRIDEVCKIKGFGEKIIDSTDGYIFSIDTNNMIIDKSIAPAMKKYILLDGDPS